MRAFHVAIGTWSVSIAAAIHLHQLASTALTHLELFDEVRHIFSVAYEPNPFFAITDFNASLSKLRYRHDQDLLPNLTRDLTAI